MSTENTNTMHTEQQPTNSTPEVTGGQGEKLFTQEDVNRIVSERLAREREKQTQQPQEDAREKALREREQAVAAREARHQCEDHLKALGVQERIWRDLMDALGCTDFDTFQAAMKPLEKYFVPTVIERGAPPPPNPPVRYRDNVDEQIKAAFAPGTVAPRPKPIL